MQLVEKRMIVKKLGLELEQANSDKERLAEVVNTQAAHEEVELSKLRAEIQLLEVQTEKLALVNQRLHLENDLASAVLSLISAIEMPLTADSRTIVAMKLLQPIQHIARSPLEIAEIEMITPAEGV